MSAESLSSIRLFRAAAWLGAVASIAATSAHAQSRYDVHNLATDGFYEGAHKNASLINSWGLASSGAGKWWVANQGSGVAVLFDGTGTPDPLVVDMPKPEASAGGAASGVAFNNTGSFVITDGTSSAPAVFLFAGLDGVISGWNPTLPLPSPSTRAHVAVDGSPRAAMYIGVAVANTANGPRLYAADFHNKRIDVFDGAFNSIRTPGAFVDPEVPSSFAPFNVMNLQGRIYVSYAMQKQNGVQPLLGGGLGFVSVFSTEGTLQQSLIHGGKLNGPWGMAIAPANFGELSNALLVGNLGSGRIQAYDPLTGALRGTLRKSNGDPFHVEGLWGLAFGNNGLAGPSNALFFAAGPGGEQHGVFGRIDSL